MGQPVGGTGAGQALTTAAAAPPQSPLAKAASYVNHSLAMDGQYPELEQYCKRKFERVAR
jgi:hypothetical protein